MKKFLPILFLVLGWSLQAQIQADSIISLKSPLTESSGLLLLNGTFITHNDSGNDPVLYEIDTLTGLPSRTVYISNASNIDWEDLAVDDSHLYIGDFGNNQGTRQDLRIYKVALADYWASDTVTADTINFSYADQTSFTPMPFQTNFDAEALISRGDSLYVFTKQWGTVGSRAYKIPKTPGTYSVHVYAALNISSGLVTGADYLEDYAPGINLLAVTINLASNPKIAFFLDGGGTFGEGGMYDFFTYVFGSIQVEGICVTNDNLYITSEIFAGQPAMLSRAAIPPFMAIEEHENFVPVSIYPNPGQGIFHFIKNKKQQVEILEIYSLDGILQEQFEQPALLNNSFSVSLPTGVYFVIIHFDDGSKGLSRLAIQ